MGARPARLSTNGDSSRKASAVSPAFVSEKPPRSTEGGNAKGNSAHGFDYAG